MDRKQYQFWSSRKTSDNQDAPIYALELAAGILKDGSAEWRQLMLKAIMSVEVAWRTEDQVFAKAIRKKVEEIDKLILKHPQD